MKAVFNNIIVKVLDDDNDIEQTGLILPNKLNNEGFEKAEVISVSSEHNDKLSIGDIVLIYKGSGKEFHHPDNNEAYRIVNISEVPVVL